MGQKIEKKIEKGHSRISACNVHFFLGSEQNKKTLYLQYCNIVPPKTQMLRHAEIQLGWSHRCKKKSSSNFKKKLEVDVCN